MGLKGRSLCSNGFVIQKPAGMADISFDLCVLDTHLFLKPRTEARAKSVLCCLNQGTPRHGHTSQGRSCVQVHYIQQAIRQFWPADDFALKIWRACGIHEFSRLCFAPAMVGYRDTLSLGKENFPSWEPKIQAGSGPGNGVKSDLQRSIDR